MKNFSIKKNSKGLTVISPIDNQSLMNFPAIELRNIFLNDGVMLFRGFEISTTVFSDFIGKNSRKISLDPARNFTSDKTQLVDAGYDAVGLHIENGTTPFLPPCIWFLCEKAAAIASETTYCDGVKVWEHLSSATKKLFAENKISYKRTVSELSWKKYLSTELGIEDMSQITPLHLEKVSNTVTGLFVSLNHDSSATVEYLVSAIRATQFSGELAFANSILGPSFNYEKPVIGFENNGIIPESILNELKEVTMQLTEDIKWEDGDLVGIDNTRVMHGRRAIKDNNRRIHIAMCDLI